MMNLEQRQLCGVRRARMRFRIREVLDRNNTNAKRIAEALGISHQAVLKVLQGNSHSIRVLDALRAAGVPERYLFDPRSEHAMDLLPTQEEGTGT
ncbi:XRE family transcriptional regulator [Nitratidesulfovibrio liaohensis]|uniref:XRE family transcriptional regulator n=1 Tax=Nitratidesulfovibrio liaohensis TaxID=2604158 RepID=UPI0014239352|nr:XRE family transcriptional regulator [Nitratidesulfovibrio liaohensis]NHZ46209.1 XRE family transcriptional regulator [Nitratidesulfovibrio liaohensis]